MKKVLVVLVVIISILTLTSCKETDAQKFKNEYESLNGKTINDKKVRNVSISKNNPFVYKTEDDIIEMMDNKESFVVYFGFSKCPWCRSVLETLIEVAKDQNLDTIYYVDVYDIRDTLKVGSDGSTKVEKKGTNGYYKILEYMDNVLDDYYVYQDNEKMYAKEKRIYAPNVVAVVDGKATKMTTGISEKQTDAYMKITKEMKKETYNKFNCVIKCMQDSKNTCTKEKEC